MRGKAVFPARQHRTAGITPACAGKSWPGYTAPCRSRDHPRACGEKFNLKEMSKTLLGSPPRVRGKGVVDVLVPEPFGITPAYAGKRTANERVHQVREDHPRMCGEKLHRSVGQLRAVGSPPRMRGKVAHPEAPSAGPGITPAYAGKSIAPGRPAPGLRDHPRVCGEKNPSALVSS